MAVTGGYVIHQVNVLQESKVRQGSNIDEEIHLILNYIFQINSGDLGFSFFFSFFLEELV